MLGKRRSKPTSRHMLVWTWNLWMPACRYTRLQLTARETRNEQPHQIHIAHLRIVLVLASFLKPDNVYNHCSHSRSLDHPSAFLLHSRVPSIIPKKYLNDVIITMCTFCLAISKGTFNLIGTEYIEIYNISMYIYVFLHVLKNRKRLSEAE